MSFSIFPGQGVRYLDPHSAYGYGMVVLVDYPARKAGVKFLKSDGWMVYNVISFDMLGPAALPPGDFEALQKSIKGIRDDRGTRTLISVDDVADQMTVKSTSEPLPPQDVRVPSADASMTGGKCAHGVYIIPMGGQQSDACTICHPREIRAKEGSTYKA